MRKLCQFQLCERLVLLFPIHGTVIFTYMQHKTQLNVGKYTSPMDPIWFNQHDMFNDMWMIRRTVSDPVVFSSLIGKLGSMRHLKY